MLNFVLFVHFVMPKFADTPLIQNILQEVLLKRIYLSKGILTAEGAKLAVQHGADAIIVSNHGGRQLDGVLATVSTTQQFKRPVPRYGGHFAWCGGNKSFLYVLAFINI